MSAWNLNGAIAAMNPANVPTPYKIAMRSQPEAVYMSAATLEAAKRVCGRREVVLLNGKIVFDPKGA